MKTKLFVALLLASALTAGTVVAQPAPYNDIGVTMGHWHSDCVGVGDGSGVALAVPREWLWGGWWFSVPRDDAGGDNFRGVVGGDSGCVVGDRGAAGENVAEVFPAQGGLR